jgi:uncharacterized protein YjbI with pentapeptide repeats
MIKIQIKSIFGSVLFEYEKEKNTVKDTLIEAVNKKADLSSADLKSANLSHANLSSADLKSADLRYADLKSANLSYADLRYADLKSANLSYADLRYADLKSANLSYADLRYADLKSADLKSANLSYADLRYADLKSANLSSADLSSADLKSANLSYADLRYADLKSANLSHANLSSADLRSAVGSDLAIAITRLCPDGDIIGWKKCRNNVIVKLMIPKNAKRNNAFSRKCRAEFADVLEVIGSDIGYSDFSKEFSYEAGKRVMPLDPFNEDFTNECSSGIHFFITRLEAEKYDL